MHHCLGATLARMEGRAALSALLDRFRCIELVDAPPVGRFASVQRDREKASHNPPPIRNPPLTRDSRRTRDAEIARPARPEAIA